MRRCACPRGYKGKQCGEVEFCQLQGCPLNSHCRNLDRGYECVSNATFDGLNTTLSYRLRVPRATALAADPLEPHDLPDSLTITYRYESVSNATLDSYIVTY
ncbi:jg227 [Pararge aegeria aegeria]|uniref:Jg227 protein n=1 Tax=Pararge aegeria aegeria TaxID=348720 RepID=A0A8S4QQT2_9NEOP|nr:jg227 [Pararge aegeria aegeria]